MAIDASREATLKAHGITRSASELDPNATGTFYVTIHRGKQWGVLAGPYGTAGEANANVGKAKRLAMEVDRQAFWDVFCTVDATRWETGPKCVRFTQEQLDRGTIDPPEPEEPPKKGRKVARRVSAYTHST